MSLLDLYAEERDRATAREWANPLPLPEPSFNIAKTLGAGKAVAAAAMESLGSVSDLLGAGLTLVDTGPGGVAMSQGEIAARKAASEALSRAGRAMRAKAEDWMPDPQTAHWSQQAVAGLTRFGAKAVFDVGLFGPVVGASVLGLDEANTTAQRLMEKGIDANTAWQVGGVTGVLSAGGAVMPMAGGTLAKTAALVALGGPVQYMAQEGLSKKILQNANYEKEAALHDPFDPLGLGISTAAAALFGAAGMARMRSVRRLESVRAEQQAQASAHLEKVVEHIESGGRRFADDGSLLTSPKGAQGEMQVMPETASNPGFGITPAKDKSPEELARVGREYLAAMKTRYGDTDQALAAYNAGPGTVDAAIKAHGEDWLAHMPEETQKYVAKARKLIDDHVAMVAAKSPEVTDAARVAVLDDTVARSLPDAPNAHAEMVRAADDVAAGKAPVILEGPDPWDVPRPAAEPPHPSMLADELRSMGTMAFWAQRGGQMIRSGIDEPGDGGMGGAVVGRTPWIPAEEWFGRMRSDLEGSGLSKQADIQTAIEKAIAGEKLKAKEQRTIDWMRSEIAEMRRQAEIAGLDEPAATDLAREGFDAGLGKADAYDLAVTARAAQIDETAVERAAIQYENDDAAFMAEMKRIVLNDINRTQAENADASVSAGRFEERAPAQASSRAAEAGKELVAPSPETAAVEAMAKASPDMQVRLPGTEKTVSLADALEQIRAAAKDEAGFADLVQVAAQCALTGGLTGAA